MPKPKHPARCLVVSAPHVDTSYKISGRYSAFVSHCTTPHHAQPFETQLYADDATALAVRAYFFGDFAQWSGHELTWERSRSMTLHEAEKAAKTLRPIVKRLDRMQGEEGTPTLGQWFARVARALDCQQIVIHDPASMAKDETRPDGAWRVLFRHELARAIEIIDRQANAIGEEVTRRARSMAA